MNVLDTAGPATCAAIAQIMPVFLVALIAERVVLRKTETISDRRMAVVATTIRILVDLTLACALLLTTLLSLTAIEVGGVSGQQAEVIWGLTISLFVGVLYRWLLLSTPLLGLFNQAADGIAAALVTLVESVGAVPEWLARSIQVFVELAAGVLSAGLASGVQSLSELVARSRR